jgi:flagellar biosynthesis protein FliQ
MVLIAPAVVLSLSMSSTLEVSIVQNKVSVKEDGVVFIEEIVCTLLGWLVGGVRATSA